MDAHTTHEYAIRPRAAVAVRRPRSRTFRSLWWLPAIGITAALVASMLGIRLVPGAAALPVTGDVTVTADVQAELHLIDACPAGAVAIGVLTPGGGPAESASACTITFGTTNHGPGTDLTVSDPVNAGSDAMVCITVAGDCTTGVDSLPDASSPLSLATTDSWFSMRLDSVASGAIDDWTLNAGGAGVGAYTEVADVPSVACHTANTADGDCNFYFAAQASDTQAPGDYEATVRFDVQPR